MGAFFALLFFKKVTEEGEVQKEKALLYIKRHMRNKVNEATSRKTIKEVLHRSILIKARILKTSNGVIISLRRWSTTNILKKRA